MTLYASSQVPLRRLGDAGLAEDYTCEVVLSLNVMPGLIQDFQQEHLLV